MFSGTSRGRLAACLFVLCLAPTSLAAPTAADRKTARELAQQATAAFSEGDFQRAAELVRRAYDLDPAPILLYNLARALEAAGEDKQALDAYRSYLESAPEAADRGAVERRIATLEQKLDERRALEQKARERPKPATPPAPAPAPPPERSPSIAPWLLMGGGAALLATGGVLAFVAQGHHDDAADPTTSGRDAARSQDRADSFARFANVGFIGGGALAAVGVTWLLLSGSEQPTVGVRVSPGHAHVTGTF